MRCISKLSLLEWVITSKEESWLPVHTYKGDYFEEHKGMLLLEGPFSRAGWYVVSRYCRLVFDLVGEGVRS